MHTKRLGRRGIRHLVSNLSYPRPLADPILRPRHRPVSHLTAGDDHERAKAGTSASAKTTQLHLLTVALLCLAIAPLHAQNFAIDWHTIDGGGGTSSGGNFSLSGTIGQTDAGLTMTNGGFSLTGGFWSLFVVQTPNAPLLTITRLSAMSARVSWPSPSTGFVLQEKSDLNTTNWVNAAQAVSDNGSTRSVTVNPAAGRRFYRLFKP